MREQALPQLDELYKEIILDHYRSPQGREPLERVDIHSEGVNPLCGDEIKLSFMLKNNIIDKIFIEAHGCSISLASGSILASILKGKTLSDARLISSSFKEMMHGNLNPNGHKIDLGDLEALGGVKKFPLRIKCALLPWTTMEEAVSGHKHVEVT